MYTIEMAYARMREMQDAANRSRNHQAAVQHRASLGSGRKRAAKKR